MTCILVDLSGWSRPAFEMLPPEYLDSGERIEVTRFVVTKLVKLLTDEKPTHLAFCADTSGPVWQTDLWPGYKLGRKPPGPEYERQHDRIIEILRLHEIPVYRAPGFQADDCVAAAVAAILEHSAGCSICEGSGEPCDCNDGLPIDRVVLATKDRDWWQLISEARHHDGARRVPVTVFDGTKRIGIPEVIERFGVAPRLVGDVLALMGDKDEAPGIEGIGLKTASALIKRHGSLVAVLAGWESEKGKLRERLRDGAASAILSRELVGLRADTPIEFDSWALRVGWGEDAAAALRLMAIDLQLGRMADVEAFPKGRR